MCSIMGKSLFPFIHSFRHDCLVFHPYEYFFHSKDTNIENDDAFNRALATSHGRNTFTMGPGGKPPTTAFRPTTTNRFTFINNN